MTLYVASPTKRVRASSGEMDDRHQALLDITAMMQPMT